MKAYMKMSDYFVGDMLPEDIVILDGGVATIIYTIEEAAAHAINSHDELVAEVERLRGALQDAYIDGCHAGWDMSGEGYNAEYGGPEDGAMHDMFVTKSIEYMK